ncbi:pyridoxamine 5'-phosphate oxidase [Stackebrandtia albiflava]|uniref:Pyridoxamine 5'-phosphate oxidase n=1 Tax=Stackebrandtia albiflava TaxID=406432 RepID=A0A562V4M0_9ACTN|nr:pyridoxamine 5'-phosphate oxidase family protein [Stackebrandtia albiflava]TWJ12841.1 pyridoxamine 5'-phosphate oxidase [Stackebrandtia albiflava]
MADARRMLEEYVSQAKVMQLATTAPTGHPAICHLWFASALRPDRLWFISRHDREHCANLRARPQVAGAVLNTTLDELGGTPVRGVTFTGTARQLPTTGVDVQVSAYLARWPKAVNAIDVERLAKEEVHHRIYEIAVDGWVLFDELESKPPKQEVAAW